jgi:hypothetical protein
MHAGHGHAAARLQKDFLPMQDGAPPEAAQNLKLGERDMTTATAGPSPNEERLIAEAQANFAGFFRWIGILNDMLQKDVGPKAGLIVNNPDVNVVESTVSATLDVSRPGKPALSIPFTIAGDTIRFMHPKFELTDKATGQKSANFTSSRSDDVNRILADVIQDYIG